MTNKEQLLRLTQKVARNKKYHPKPVENPTLEVEGIPSNIYADTQIFGKSYRAKCSSLREVLRKITKE